MTDRPLYRYAASLVRVVDGDTVVLEIDLGFNIRHRAHVRLFGVNTPELRAPTKSAGLDAKMFAATWFWGAPPLYIESNRYDEREKYGRILATIFRADDPVSLNDALLSAGLAVPMAG